MDYFKTMLQRRCRTDRLLSTTRSTSSQELQTTDTTYSTRGGLTKQSITQIDYAYLRSDNNKHYATVLTMFESITGLGYATVVPYKGVNTEAVKAILRFIVENGLQSTIQSDGENAIKELQSEITRTLPHVKSQIQETSAHTVHYSITCYITPHGYSTDIYDTTTERLATRETGIDPTTRTSLHLEKRSTSRPKFLVQEQKYEAIWIGRDTTTGQHITLTTEFGKQISRKHSQITKGAAVRQNTTTQSHIDRR
eukprot:2433662-Amphidinium_carterae.1